MAKNKTKKSAKPRKGRSPINRPERSSDDSPKLQVERLIVPDAETPRPIGPMTGVEIGHVAGEVWGMLTRHGELTLTVLKKEVAAPPDMILAAIGWLAREDKLEFSTAARTVKVSLR